MTAQLRPVFLPTSLPLAVNVRGQAADGQLRAFVERRLAYALSRFRARLRAVDVWVEDQNGPRGGVDKRCRIDVSLRPRGRVTVTAQAANEYAAVARAAQRCTIALDRRNKRRFSKRRLAVQAGRAA